MLARDRLRVFLRPLRFGLVGILNTAIDIAVFTLLLATTTLSPVAANTISYCVGILNSFVCNKYWTFGDIQGQRPARVQLPIFIATNLVGLAVANLALVAASHAMPIAPAKLVSVLSGMAWNYWASRTFVYRRAQERG
jgi:putative flippase GtrA